MIFYQVGFIDLHYSELYAQPNCRNWESLWCFKI